MEDKKKIEEENKKEKMRLEQEKQEEKMKLKRKGEEEKKLLEKKHLVEMKKKEEQVKKMAIGMIDIIYFFNKITVQSRILKKRFKRADAYLTRWRGNSCIPEFRQYKPL
jgi:hypothetical protein